MLKISLNIQKLLILIIGCYQFFLSPFLGKSCRFYPTCSEYAKDAIMAYGSVKGIILAIYRILRCQPFGNSDFDPVINKDENC